MLTTFDARLIDDSAESGADAGSYRPGGDCIAGRIDTEQLHIGIPCGPGDETDRRDILTGRDTGYDF